METTTTNELKKAEARSRRDQAYPSDYRVFTGGGTLQVMPTGFGLLRQTESNYLDDPNDVYVSPAQIRRFNLLTGMTIVGDVRAPSEKERHPALLRISSVDGLDPDAIKQLPRFDALTSTHPHERLLLESGRDELSVRVVDLLTPVGKGQRGLIVAPPRTGKTLLLESMAKAVQRNHPECYLFVLLIDERPEEVTEMRSAIHGDSVEVISSTFDRPAQEQIQIAELVLEKAKRLVEQGRDVVILLDSITRLARAYNAEMSANGRLLSGGLTVGALDKPKRFFGAARNTQEGGSLTILATALVDTGSRMDQVIFEEFKGTGNMEVHLDRRLADQRVWPAINLRMSGTRREELLLHPDELGYITQLRRALATLDPMEAMRVLTERLRKCGSNAELLLALHTL